MTDGIPPTTFATHSRSSEDRRQRASKGPRYVPHVLDGRIAGSNITGNRVHPEDRDVSPAGQLSARECVILLDSAPINV